MQRLLQKADVLIPIYQVPGPESLSWGRVGDSVLFLGGGSGNRR